jgi:hypothetical protein
MSLPRNGPACISTPPLRTVTFVALSDVAQFEKTRVPEMSAAESSGLSLVISTENGAGIVTPDPSTGTPLSHVTALSQGPEFVQAVSARAFRTPIAKINSPKTHFIFIILVALVSHRNARIASGF